MDVAGSTEGTRSVPDALIRIRKPQCWHLVPSPKKASEHGQPLLRNLWRSIYYLQNTIDWSVGI